MRTCEFCITISMFLSMPVKCIKNYIKLRYIKFLLITKNVKILIRHYTGNSDKKFSKDMTTSGVTYTTSYRIISKFLNIFEILYFQNIKFRDDLFGFDKLDLKSF